MTRDSEPLRLLRRSFPSCTNHRTNSSGSLSGPSRRPKLPSSSGAGFFFSSSSPSSSLEPFLTLTGAGTRKMDSPTFLVRGWQRRKTLGTWHHRRRVPYSVISPSFPEEKPGLRGQWRRAAGGSCASGSLFRVREEKMRARSDLKRKSL